MYLALDNSSSSILVGPVPQAGKPGNDAVPRGWRVCMRRFASCVPHLFAHRINSASGAPPCAVRLTYEDKGLVSVTRQTVTPSSTSSMNRKRSCSETHLPVIHDRKTCLRSKSSDCVSPQPSEMSRSSFAEVLVRRNDVVSQSLVGGKLHVKTLSQNPSALAPPSFHITVLLNGYPLPRELDPPIPDLDHNSPMVR